MGIAEEEFIKAFSAALSNEEIIRKLQNVVVSQLRKEVSELREIIKNKDKHLDELKSRVSTLEETVDNQEQYSRRNILRISGVPENDNEEVGNLILSLDLFNKKMKLDPPISAQAIDRIHRTGPVQGTKPRAILVKFATYQERQRVYRGRLNLKPHRRGAVNSQTRTQDNSTDIEQTLPDPSTRHIFINEDLTKKRATLLWRARKLKHDGRIHDCWSHDGRILIKNLVNKIIPINNENELVRLTT